MVVKLSGDAKDIHSEKEGIYILSLDLVNGKSYWMQEEGISVLWFDKTFNNWKIGNKAGLGGKTSAFYSNTNVNEPQDATIWNYYNNRNKTWIKSNETEVYAGNNTKRKIPS